MGQTITVADQAFVVSAMKQLAKGVEYYTAKAAAPNAKPVNFLRTDDSYHATVFTQAQYEAFLKMVKVPSFGKLMQSISGKDTLMYTVMGNTIALVVATDNNELVLFEYIGGAQAMPMTGGSPAPSRPKPPSNHHTYCLDQCRGTRNSCLNNNAATAADKDKCWSAFGLCAAGCSLIPRMQPASVHVIPTTVPVALY